jgi:hypothetical protein
LGSHPTNEDLFVGPPGRSRRVECDVFGMQQLRNCFRAPIQFRLFSVVAKTVDLDSSLSQAPCMPPPRTLTKGRNWVARRRTALPAGGCGYVYAGGSSGVKLILCPTVGLTAYASFDASAWRRTCSDVRGSGEGVLFHPGERKKSTGWARRSVLSRAPILRCARELHRGHLISPLEPAWLEPDRPATIRNWKSLVLSIRFQTAEPRVVRPMAGREKHFAAW